MKVRDLAMSDCKISEGAMNMLLHIARVRPLPKPFPPQSEGLRHLVELLNADLIEQVAEGKFMPTASGCALARPNKPGAHEGEAR